MRTRPLPYARYGQHRFIRSIREMGQRQGERTSRSNTMSDAIGHHDTTTAEHAHHEELSWIRKYVFSTDHKVIGIWYGVTALLFLLFGFCLIMLLRWQVA